MAPKFAKYRLFYISHIDNVPSILERGVLAHNLVEQEGIAPQTVSNEQVMQRRKSRSLPTNRSLWDYANLYFQPCNAMLYQVVLKFKQENIVVLEIDPTILGSDGVLVSIGNAASANTPILTTEQGLPQIDRLRKVLEKEYWSEEDGSKRQMMAACLVPERVPPHYIKAIYVASARVQDTVMRRIQPTTMTVIPEPNMFFWPQHTYSITQTLSLVDGDMFFSFAQTLTISVNTQGVMGKGLASRAKYQFPDVYVVYQDVCRSRELKPGVPYLYKREASLDEELSAEPYTVSGANAVKWFLLFPTKRNWRDPSRIDDIEQGLIWLRETYHSEGITSLALPALGCGLGQLDWADVGPLMCRYLADLPIPVRIYLPRERDKDIPNEQLTYEFLLSN